MNIKTAWHEFDLLVNRTEKIKQINLQINSIKDNNNNKIINKKFRFYLTNKVIVVYRNQLW